MLNVVVLDSENVCITVKQVKSDYTLQPGEVLVDSFDTDNVGKTYNSETGQFAFTQSQIEERAKQWRDSELARTDLLITLIDYPYVQEMLSYRAALRNWPVTEDFPNVKPHSP